MGFGVAFGANRPPHTVKLKPGKLSATVSICGRMPIRFGVVTAITFNFPLLISGIAVDVLEKNRLTRPLRRSGKRLLIPLYGTWTIFELVPISRATAAKCPGVPCPREA